MGISPVSAAASVNAHGKNSLSFLEGFSFPWMLLLHLVISWSYMFSDRPLAPNMLEEEFSTSPLFIFLKRFW